MRPSRLRNAVKAAEKCCGNTARSPPFAFPASASLTIPSDGTGEREEDGFPIFVPAPTGCRILSRSTGEAKPMCMQRNAGFHPRSSRRRAVRVMRSKFIEQNIRLLSIIKHGIKSRRTRHLDHHDATAGNHRGGAVPFCASAIPRKDPAASSHLHSPWFSAGARSTTCFGSDCAPKQTLRASRRSQSQIFRTRSCKPWARLGMLMGPRQLPAGRPCGPPPRMFAAGSYGRTSAKPTDRSMNISRLAATFGGVLPDERLVAKLAKKFDGLLPPHCVVPQVTETAF